MTHDSAERTRRPEKIKYVELSANSVACLIVFIWVCLQPVVDVFVSEYMPVQKGVKKPANPQEPSRGYSSWFSSWRRTSEPKKMMTSDVSTPVKEVRFISIYIKKLKLKLFHTP